MIDELVEKLRGVYFTNLDIFLRYHQIRNKEEEILKITLKTHDVHYEFKVMPFGLANAPSTFQGSLENLC